VHEFVITPTKQTEDRWFATKVAVFDSTSFGVIVGWVTYVDARLTTHVTYGARHYRGGYAISAIGSLLIFVTTLIFLAKPYSWKIKATLPATILIIAGAASLPFFRPEFPHGGLTTWMLFACFVCLVSCWIHYSPIEAHWLTDGSVSTSVKIERIKEYASLWRTIAISLTIGYIAVLIPWTNFLWDQAPHFVSSPSERILLSQFGAGILILLSIYVLVGVVYEAFKKANTAADKMLEISEVNAKTSALLPAVVARQSELAIPSQTTDPAMNRAEVLAACFEEYKALRAEQVKRLEVADKNLNYIAIIMAAILGGALSLMGRDQGAQLVTVTLLLVPSLATPFIFTMLSNELMIIRLGVYCYDKLRPMVLELVADQRLWGWERYHVVQSKGWMFGISSLLRRFIYVLPSVAPPLIFLLLRQGSLTKFQTVLLILDFALGSLTILLLLFYRNAFARAVLTPGSQGPDRNHV
jgi:hypothetical protein